MKNSLQENSRTSYPIVITIPLVSLCLAYLSIVVGCGSSGTTTTAITSAEFSTTGAVELNLAMQVASFVNLYEPRMIAPTTTVSDFKFCVKRLKLEGEDGSAIRKDGELDEDGKSGADDLKFEPGLIDLSDGKEKNWGNLEIPTGFKLSKIKIKVKKDTNLCGVNYSVKFNEHYAVEDIEFRMKFKPAIDLDTGTSILQLSFSDLVALLRQYADDGRLNNKIRETIESVEGAAAKK